MKNPILNKTIVCILSTRFRQLLALFLIICLTACVQEEINQSIKSAEEHKKEIQSLSKEDLRKSFVFDVMKIAYLWNDQLPESVDFSKYRDERSLLNSLRQGKDRWSYIQNSAASENLFERGKALLWGFSAFSSQNQVYLDRVYQDTEFYKNGVNNRGWKVEKINGTAVTLSNYTDLLKETQEGATRTVQVSKNGVTKEVKITYKELTVNTTDHTKIFTTKDGTKIGYVYFTTFIRNSVPELNEAFGRFKNAGVNKLILDLRDNGGGYLYVSEYLCRLIAGKHLAGKTFIKYRYNENLTNLSESYAFSTQTLAGSLDLKEVTFLVSKNTASASEATIDALIKAGIDVQLIGEATHGKPAGMLKFKAAEAKQFKKEYGKAFDSFHLYADKYTELDYTLYCINFESGTYYNGFPVAQEIKDNYFISLGDENEALLNKALKTYNYETKQKKLSKKWYPPQKRKQLEGIDLITGGVL